jgi:hypothetical protein
VGPGDKFECGIWQYIIMFDVIPVEIIVTIFMFYVCDECDWLNIITKYGRIISQEMQKRKIMFPSPNWEMAPPHLAGKFDKIMIFDQNIKIFNFTICSDTNKAIMGGASTLDINTTSTTDSTFKNMLKYVTNNITTLCVADRKFGYESINMFSGLVHLSEYRVYCNVNKLSPSIAAQLESYEEERICSSRYGPTRFSPLFTSLRRISTISYVQIHHSVCARLRKLKVERFYSNDPWPLDGYFSTGPNKIIDSLFPNLVSLTIMYGEMDVIPVLPKLRYLEIRSYSVNDQLPSEMTELEKLTLMDCDNIYGGIPPTMTKLRYIYLRGLPRIFVGCRGRPIQNDTLTTLIIDNCGPQ